MTRRPAGALALLVTIVLAARASAQPAESLVMDVPLERGHMLRALYQAPATPTAVAVLFPGGGGRIGIDGRGNVAFTGNFLVRSRAHFHAAGIATATLDAPSYTRDLLGERLDSQYARAIRETVARLRKRTPAPIWLVGTSAGTVGAVNAAAAIPAGEIAGLVLTSPVTLSGPNTRSRETVFGAELGRIAAPTLIVVHEADACALTPPNQAARLRAALGKVPKANILTLKGGAPPTDPNPCEAHTPHGFLGLEKETIQSIVAQMAALTAP
jgi:hypothetical protein